MAANAFEQIYKSAEKFLTPLTLEETYSNIVDELLKLSGTQIQEGMIILHQEDGWKRVYISHDFYPKVKIRKRGFTYKAFQAEKPLIVHYAEIVKVHPQLKKGPKWKYSIHIPLSYGGKKLGVVILRQIKGKPLNQKKLDTLKIFASLATLAIRKNQLYSEAKKALQARELFISMAAHELKTPLTTINAYTQLFQKNLDQRNVNKKWVEQLSKATDRLTKLVTELLEIEQIKQGALIYHWTKISLKNIIYQAVTDFIFFNPKHRIIFINKLENQTDIVWGDADKLLQVFSNVLNNAAKFSPEESKVRLTLEYKKPYYRIQIEDQGIGINKQDLIKIFDKFYKGNQQNREGLGLGLYLSRKIIKKHKGDIFISNSEQSKGTLVRITLPSIDYGK